MARPARLSPPPWLTAGLRPAPAPVPWAAAVARASVALSAPLDPLRAEVTSARAIASPRVSPG
ncbi:hypothetical protein ACFUJR_15715 [Streptomyces sp. NPDC057271]|uniref:hypothetical protein n=1 Tax=unclassified Streptomyces TaxID=2593676 RepID=UPI003645F2A0